MLCVQQHPYVRVIGSLAFFFSRVTVGDMSARRYPAGGGGGGGCVGSSGGEGVADLVSAVRV